jgi:hypothetical protein
MTVDGAPEFFVDDPQVLRPLTVLREVGLGYLRLGQPATGLHPSDVERLQTQLDGLVDAGNTVIVVEHDMRMIAASDWIIDVGQAPVMTEDVSWRVVRRRRWLHPPKVVRLPTSRGRFTPPRSIAHHEHRGDR